MSQAIAAAVVSRWDARSLDTSIASLYPGEDEASPEGTSLPRAQYILLDDRQIFRSRGRRIYQTPVQFEVFADGYSNATSYKDSIESEFVNSENATANAFSISASTGCVISVDWSSGTVTQEDDNIYRALVTLLVTWQKNETFPA